MSRQAPVRDVAPIVSRIRVRHARRGRLRFSSHRDFQRALERALRRAEVPVAFSQGFNPRPRISYANAAATGVASEAEYVEIALTAEVDPDRARLALDGALPPGLDVLDVVIARTPDLVARLEASVFELRLPEVPAVAAGRALEALLAADTVEVERLTKSGVRRFDARSAVLVAQLRDTPGTGSSPSARSGEARPCAILDLVVRHHTPAVRPDDVLAALRQVADLDAPVAPQVTRWAQGPLVADPGSGPPRDAVTDPLAPDRDEAAVGARGTT
ncbi:MAG TPA: TIGR03936 family radical SAM-associated protein [Candidatus Nanopelagicales bacterium]|nr:TIGR03936 family radical SAM-associated protein [Candidatus Nanopelagicales bacterium]